MQYVLVWLNGESYEFATTQVYGQELREIFQVGEKTLWLKGPFTDELIEDSRVVILYSGMNFFTH